MSISPLGRPALLAGAGIRGGITYGRSDKDAAYPVDHPVSPENLAATVFHFGTVSVAEVKAALSEAGNPVR